MKQKMGPRSVVIRPGPAPYSTRCVKRESTYGNWAITCGCYPFERLYDDIAACYD